jgi:hypothetical protein
MGRFFVEDPAKFTGAKMTIESKSREIATYDEQ